MTTQTLLKLETSEAIERWNKLAFANSTELTIAHNPALFPFYFDYLKLTPYFCILYNNQKPIGLLPIVLAGNKMISMPHFSHGGIIRLNNAIISFSDESLIELVDHLLWTEKSDAGFYEVHLDQIKNEDQLTLHPLEIRQTTPLFGNQESEKVNHFIPLKQNSEEQLISYNSNLRRKINKAAKNGIKVKIGGVELVDDFSKVYNKNMHQLGSPTLGKDFFKSLLETLAENSELAVAYLNSKPIGGGFCMWYDFYYENTWFSTLQEFNQLYTSYALHDKMISSAISKKVHTYSMGRSSKNSGVQQYKLQWPVEEKDLFFNSTSSKGVSLKEQKWLTKVWRFLPGILVDNLGPAIAKRIY